MHHSGRPLLIILQGASGVGKTTLAHRLKDDLQCGIIACDDVKEYFFDTIRTGGLSWSNTLGKTLEPICYTLTELIYSFTDESTRRSWYNQRLGARHVGHVSMYDETFEMEHYRPIDACERIDYDTAGSDDDNATLLKMLQDKMPKGDKE